MFNILSTSRQVLFLCLVLSLSACQRDEFEVTTFFADDAVVSQGDPLYFDGRKIGRVVAVNTATTGTNVRLAINADVAKQISAQAAVVINSFKPSMPLELVNRGQAEKNPLQPGQSVQGINSILELGAWLMGDAIEVGQNSVTAYVDAFSEYLESDEFQHDKAELERQVGTTRNAAQEALSQIKREMEQAVERINEQEQLTAQSIERLGDELAPLLAQLSAGGGEIAVQLEQFSEQLEAAGRTAQPIGEKALQSLITTLEKLQRSIEQDEALRALEEDAPANQDTLDQEEVPAANVLPETE